MIKFSWAVVDCSLNPASCLLVSEAAHMGVGAIATDCPAYRNLGIVHLLPSTPLKSASGRMLRIPQEGVLAQKFKQCSQMRPEPVSTQKSDLLEKISMHIVGRKQRDLEVEEVTSS